MFVALQSIIIASINIPAKTVTPPKVSRRLHCTNAPKEACILLCNIPETPLYF
jgi:hypothetical protein